MAATTPQVPDASPSPPPGSNRASVVAMVVILAACATVVLFRNAIRVRWWSHQLATASSPPERAYYLDLLLRTGEAALPAARSLASRDEAALRTYAVALAATVSGPAADELLARAARD